MRTGESDDAGEDLWRKPVNRLQQIPQRREKFQNFVCSGFEVFNLKGRTLNPVATLAEVGRLGCAHLDFKDGDRSRDMGETDSPHPGAFQTEFLVQGLEELGDREVESGPRRHGGGCRTKVWLLKWLNEADPNTHVRSDGSLWPHYLGARQAPTTVRE